MKSRIRQYQEHGSEGFTLIELLIVIIIIGILAAIVVFSVSGVNNTAAKNACNANLNEANTAIEAFYAGGNPQAYPADWTKLATTYLHINLTTELSNSNLTWTPAGQTYTFTYVPLTHSVTLGGPSAVAGACA